MLAPDNEGLKPVDLARDNNHEDAYKLLFKVTKSKLLVRRLEVSIHVAAEGVGALVRKLS